MKPKMPESDRPPRIDLSEIELTRGSSKSEVRVPFSSYSTSALNVGSSNFNKNAPIIHKITRATQKATIKVKFVIDSIKIPKKGPIAAAKLRLKP